MPGKSRHVDPERLQEPLRNAVARMAKAGRAAAQTSGPRAGKLAQDATLAVSRKVDAARPEIEHLAQQAAPHAKRAGQEAAAYGRRHKKELVQAGGLLARAAAPRRFKAILAILSADPKQPPRPREKD